MLCPTLVALSSEQDRTYQLLLVHADVTDSNTEAKHLE